MSSSTLDQEKKRNYNLYRSQNIKPLHRAVGSPISSHYGSLVWEWECSCDTKCAFKLFGRLFTVPCVARLTVNDGHLDFQMRQRFSNASKASGIIALVGGGGREKYFSRFLPNRPRPLSSFDNHARWQPVTQSARSRRSYEKIEDCKQSSFSVMAAAAATGRVYIIYGGLHSDSSKTLINSWRPLHHKKHLKSKTVL